MHRSAMRSTKTASRHLQHAAQTGMCLERLAEPLAIATQHKVQFSCHLAEFCIAEIQQPGCSSEGTSVSKAGRTLADEFQVDLAPLLVSHHAAVDHAAIGRRYGSAGPSKLGAGSAEEAVAGGVVVEVHLHTRWRSATLLQGKAPRQPVIPHAAHVEAMYSSGSDEVMHHKAA